jgi:hypothetical protein
MLDCWRLVGPLDLEIRERVSRVGARAHTLPINTRDAGKSNNKSDINHTRTIYQLAERFVERTRVLF